MIELNVNKRAPTDWESSVDSLPKKTEDYGPVLITESAIP